MATFALQELTAVKGKQKFYMIFEGKYCQFKQYENDISNNKKYLSDLKRIYVYMNYVSNLMTLPYQKFHPLNNGDREYEFKSGDLRVYCFHLEKTGKIIAWGGFKNSQSEDIIQFRALKKRYLTSIVK